MSDAPNSSPAPGWYPDPAGGTLQRYWDGTAWSDRTYDPISASGAPGVYGQVGPDVKVTTPWVWIIAALPLISLIISFTVDYRQYLLDAVAQATSPSLTAQLPESFGAQLALQAAGLVIYLGNVLLAFFDWRALKQRGVQRPFHWAWTFLGAIVYMIGRAVVLRRRGRSSFAPMWVYIALLAAAIIVPLVQIIAVLPEVLEQFPTVG